MAVKIRQEINLLDKDLIGIVGSSAPANELVQIDTTQYVNPTYYFEVVGRTNDSLNYIQLLRGANVDARVPKSSLGTNYTRSRVTFDFNPPGGQSDYHVNIQSITSGKTCDVIAARIIIIDNPTTLTSSETQIEIGNNETSSATSKNPLTNPKYWTYTAANWDGTKTFYAEVTYAGSSSKSSIGYTLQEDDGSFGTWTDKVTIVSAGSATTATRVRSTSFTPTGGRHYRLAVDGTNLAMSATVSTYNAKVIVDQTQVTGITLLEPQYLLLNTANSGTGLQNYPTLYDSTEWSGVTNTYKHAADSNNALNVTKLEDTTTTTILTTSAVTGANQQISSDMSSQLVSGDTLDTDIVTATGVTAASRILVGVTVSSGTAKSLTQSAVARIANNIIKTQSAKAAIQGAVTKTQNAIGRIANNKAKTQGSIARVTNLITKTQSAIARIANNKTKTQSAKATITGVVTKTQSAISRIATNITKTQSAISRVANNITKTQAAKAAIQGAVSKTQSTIARVATNITKTQAAVARIATNLTKTQGATARVANNIIKTQSAVSRISNLITKTQPSVARVANNLSLTQSATANIQNASPGTKTQPATARIANNLTVTQAALARIANIITKTQAAIASIQGAVTKTQPAKADIVGLVTKTQSAIARVATNITKTQGAIARIGNSESKTQPAKGRIANNLTITQGALGRIAVNLTVTQSSTARVATKLTKTQGAASRIASSLTLTQPAIANITGGTFPGSYTISAKASIATNVPKPPPSVILLTDGHVAVRVGGTVYMPL